MTVTQTLKEELPLSLISSQTIRWLRYLLPLVMVGIAVHLLLPQLTELEKSWPTVLQMTGWLRL